LGKDLQVALNADVGLQDVPDEGTSAGLPVIAGYTIAAEIGAGGMATVYRARQQSLDRDVAIKLLAAHLRGDQRFVRRFQREADLQATLQHPHVIPIYESGTADGVPFIAMRWIDGPNLRSLIRLDAISAAAAVELLRDVGSALDYAHTLGVVHGDVKPQNILIENGDHAWLADFGLTRLLDERTGVTSTGTPLGSFDYMAPELAEGADASAASDLYSLAVTAYQALTGELPFPAARPSEALIAHAHAKRPRASRQAPQLPRAVDDVLIAGLAVDPDQRPSSSRELFDGLCSAFQRAPLVRGSLAPPTSSRADGNAAAAMVGPDAATLAPADAKRGVQSRRLAVGVSAGLASLAAAAAAIVLAVNGHPQAHDPVAATGPAEIVGGPSHTWSDYRSAGGAAGPVIPAYHAVRISCRVRGFTVSDGDRWWYRVASPPWNGRYYVSADAFYNNGAGHGTLLHTPLVDSKVPLC
jgi:predicted Ser/Thr protein kinase